MLLVFEIGKSMKSFIWQILDKYTVGYKIHFWLSALQPNFFTLFFVLAIDDCAKDGGEELLPRCIAIEAEIFKKSIGIDYRAQCILVKSSSLPSFALSCIATFFISILLFIPISFNRKKLEAKQRENEQSQIVEALWHSAKDASFVKKCPQLLS